MVHTAETVGQLSSGIFTGCTNCNDNLVDNEK